MCAVSGKGPCAESLTHQCCMICFARMWYLAAGCGIVPCNWHVHPGIQRSLLYLVLSCFQPGNQWWVSCSNSRHLCRLCCHLTRALPLVFPIYSPHGRHYDCVDSAEAIVCCLQISGTACRHALLTWWSTLHSFTFPRAFLVTSRTQRLASAPIIVQGSACILKSICICSSSFDLTLKTLAIDNESVVLVVVVRGVKISSCAPAALSIFLNTIFLYKPILGAPKSSFTAYLKDWGVNRIIAFCAGIICGLGNTFQFMGGQVQSCRQSIHPAAVISVFLRTYSRRMTDSVQGLKSAFPCRLPGESEPAQSSDNCATYNPSDWMLSPGIPVSCLCLIVSDVCKEDYWCWVLQEPEVSVALPLQICCC